MWENIGLILPALVALTAGRLAEKIWVDFKNYKIYYILKYSDFSPHLILVQCYYGITNFGQVFSCKAYFKVFLKCEKIKLYVVADFDTYTITQGRLWQSSWYSLGQTTFWILALLMSYKSLYNYLPSKKPEQYFSDIVYIDHHNYCFIAHWYHGMILKLESSTSSSVATSLEVSMPHHWTSHIFLSQTSV